MTDQSNSTIYRHRNDRHAVRAVIFWDQCAWVAMGLEKDLASQGPTKEEAQRRFDLTLDAEAALLAELPSLVGPGPSPARYHAMWEHADISGRRQRDAASDTC